MLIKQADDKSSDIRILEALMERSEASAEIRKEIRREIRNIQSGIKGETEAAYEMEFHYKASKNWMVLHDLRLECDGRTAQIDHLLINRFLEIYVCESKRFAEGVSINEQGEFTAFYETKPYGVPSPLEQNRRHMAVLEAVFRTGQVAPPKRIGLSLKPTLKSLVLVSKTARINRPKAKVEGVDLVIKNDQLFARIDRDMSTDNNLLLAMKIVGPDTLEAFARSLAAVHKPLTFNWSAKFGLSARAPATSATPKSKVNPIPVEVPRGDEGKASKLVCSACRASVAYSVAKFCWFNKPRFGGQIFCMECQKLAIKPA